MIKASKKNIAFPRRSVGTRTWRLLDTPPMTAAENMALDDTLLELKGRPGKEGFAADHMADLLYSSLNAGDLEVAKKIERHIPSDMNRHR